MAATQIERPILLVVVDTEEEFNWHAPLNPEAVSVTAMDCVHLGQQVFDDFAIKPTYVIDYPIASQVQGYGPLKAFLATNRATIGAHLHPWNTPPFTEQPDLSNGFPGNLPAELEAAKLQTLIKQIKHSLGITPVIYKAGRYGIGKNSAAILEAEGFEIDLSPSPPFDLSGEGGPDFSNHTNQPHWIGSQEQLLCLPTTGGYVTPFSTQFAHKLFTWSRQPLPLALHLPGILSKLHLVNRHRLSPEGYTLDEMQSLTKRLINNGVGIVSLSFHSPSLLPGCTPYVQNSSQRQQFLDRIRGYLEFFMNKLNGITMTPIELKQFLRHHSV